MPVAADVVHITTNFQYFIFNPEFLKCSFSGCCCSSCSLDTMQKSKSIAFEFQWKLPETIYWNIFHLRFGITCKTATFICLHTSFCRRQVQFKNVHSKWSNAGTRVNIIVFTLVITVFTHLHVSTPLISLFLRKLQMAMAVVSLKLGAYKVYVKDKRIDEHITLVMMMMANVNWNNHIVEMRLILTFIAILMATTTCHKTTYFYDPLKQVYDSVY